MIDPWLLSLIYAAWLAASTMPLGFMLGSSCSPCCGCGVADGKPRTDPKDEGTWVPSGTWRGVGGVTWSFTANPGDESGETWFFFASASTSRLGGGASAAEQRDWGNICNWYSNKTTSPSTTSGLPAAFNNRATRLPPATAVVHIYREVTTVGVGPQTVKNIYFWSASAAALAGSEITTTALAHDSTGGAVFNTNSFNQGTINGGATFNTLTRNFAPGIINGGATFNDNSRNQPSNFTPAFSTVNGGATFNDSSQNTDVGSTVNDGATFNGTSQNRSGAVVNGGATFHDSSENTSGGVIAPTYTTVNGGATFSDNSLNNSGLVNDSATFNGNSQNDGLAIVNGGATFNGNSVNEFQATVNGGATFNDAACSTRTIGSFFLIPCTRKFVAHPTDLPTCNGTAPDGCVNAGDTCGCG